MQRLLHVRLWNPGVGGEGVRGQVKVAVSQVSNEECAATCCWGSVIAGVADQGRKHDIFGGDLVNGVLPSVGVLGV